ncbi:MAG: GNAT family N-acetyltransferase [Myxococcota bacterium]
MTVASPSLTLRPTVRPDLPDVVAILRSTADWYRPFVDPADLESQHAVDLAWARENFERREFWSATLNGEVVGVLTMQDAGDHLYLGYVYVHRDHVGKRIGRRLLDHAAAEARRRGKEGLVLIAHPEATWAVRAYRKYGFECVATTDDDVCEWNDGWLEPYHEQGFHLWRWTPEETPAC